MNEVLRRQDRRVIDGLWLHVAGRLRLNVEDASFLMIDPDDHMRRHNMHFNERSRKFLSQAEYPRPWAYVMLGWVTLTGA